MFIKKGIRKIGGGKLLNIAFTFCVLLFINVAVNIYFRYISSPETKALFLEFSLYCGIGLFSFAAFIYSLGHNFKNISKGFKRIISILLVLLTLVSLSVALLLTTLVIPQIYQFFNYCIIKITSFKFTSSFFFVYFIAKLDSIFRSSTNDTLINIVALFSIALFVFVSLKIYSSYNISVSTKEDSYVSVPDNNYKSLRVEDIESKRFKRRLAFGYIYKVFP